MGIKSSGERKTLSHWIALIVDGLRRPQPSKGLTALPRAAPQPNQTHKRQIFCANYHLFTQWIARCANYTALANAA